MTVGINTSPFERYEGNSTTKLFPLSFPIFEPSNIIANVYRDIDGFAYPALNFDVDYTLNNVNVPNAQPQFLLIDVPGKDYLDASGFLKSGYTIYIKFNDEAFNPARFRSFGNYAPEKLDETLDRLTMTVKAVRYLASRALLMAEGGGAGFVLPSLIGHANEILVVDGTEEGFEFGPKVQDIYDARDAAQLAAINAGLSEAAAGLSETNAGTFASNAVISANAAYGFSQDSYLSSVDAATSEANALVSEQEAERWAKYYAFMGLKTITFADSPYTVDYVADQELLLNVDTSGGNIVINLPTLSGMPSSDWKVGFSKTTLDANKITVNPFAGQNINNQNSVTINSPNYGLVLTDEAPTNWEARVIVVGSFGSTATGGGGNAGISEWAPLTNYDLGELVLFDNNVYSAIISFTSANTFDAVNWNLVLTYKTNVVQISSNRTVSLEDDVLVVNCTAGVRTLTLPMASSCKKVLTIKKSDASQNQLIIAVQAGQTIDGATTMELYRQRDAVRLVGYGTTWELI